MTNLSCLPLFQLLAVATVLAAHPANPWPTERIHGTLGNTKLTLSIKVEEIAPDNEEEPVVFQVVRGVRLANERPVNFTEQGQAMGQPLCDINAITDFQQYDQPMRYPGVLKPVQCGDCDKCPGNTTWTAVYVTMPVLTAMPDSNNTLADPYYVMDMVTVPITCSCQMMV